MIKKASIVKARGIDKSAFFAQRHVNKCNAGLPMLSYNKCETQGRHNTEDYFSVKTVDHT
ncbi:hypothetical protein DWW15_18215 [Subdoligranulum sp. AF14-43]|nr:hypothetical protein DWW15_18215 [Subdoligranulum sp. AF14-43]